jgi:hypothetical protein
MAMKALARENGPNVPVETNGLLSFSCELQATGKKRDEREDA